jgi:hypothetical protein
MERSKPLVAKNVNESLIDMNDLGVQPLDALMTRLGISNADLVNASTEQLSFKMVSKARKGRRLSLNIQQKILRAFAALPSPQILAIQDLFNYQP